MAGPMSRTAAEPRAALRVLHVISAAERGGSERALVSLLRGIDPARVSAWVACHHAGPMVEEYARHAAGLCPLDFTRWFDLVNVHALTRLIRRIECDVVHTHLYRSDVQGGLAAAFARAPIRVSTVHGEYWAAGEGGGARRVRRTVMSRGYRSVYRLFDRVVAVTPQVARHLAGARGAGVPREKVVVVPVGRDVSPPPVDVIESLRNELSLPRGRPVLVTVANFFAAKGHRHLMDAMPRILERHPAATLVLVGAGPLLPDVQAQVQQRRFGAQVVFAGSRPDTAALLSLADVVVMPSTSEGLPMVLLEALGLARPVVATRAGGIPDVVEHGSTGLLVPPGDASALADAVSALLDDPARARQLARPGPGLVRARFSEAAMVQGIENLYYDLAHSKGLVANRA